MTGLSAQRSRGAIVDGTFTAASEDDSYSLVVPAGATFELSVAAGGAFDRRRKLADAGAWVIGQQSPEAPGGNLGQTGGVWG